MKIGYARVSTHDQNLERQIGALRAEKCQRIFREKASGRSLDGRPQLERAIDALATGDVLIVAEWDRATRSMLDGIQIIERIAARGAFVKVLDKPYLDLTSTMGRGILAFLSALAQDERERIAKRAREGRSVARSNGVPLGRKPKLTPEQRAEALAMLTAKGKQRRGTRAVARLLGVHHATISRLRAPT